MQLRMNWQWIQEEDGEGIWCHLKATKNLWMNRECTGNIVRIYKEGAGNPQIPSQFISIFILVPF